MRTPSDYKKNRGKRYHIRPGEVELKPLFQKSFYGKAAVIPCGDVKILRSYDTLFAAAYDGKMALISEMPMSVTTNNHLQAFAHECGISYHRQKKEWSKWKVCISETDDPALIADDVRRCIGKHAA